MNTLLRRRMMMGGNTNPPGVVFYNRLVFDGTAYVDTTVPVPENGSIRLYGGYETQKVMQRIFSADGVFDVYLNASTNNSNRYFSCCYGNTSAAISGTTLGLSFTYNSYGLFLTPKRVGYGTTTKTFTKGATSPTNGIVFGQNYNHNSTPYTGKISGTIMIFGSDAQNATSFSDLSNNYTPVATLRPCTYLNEAGLWWVEQGVFFGNSAGAGTLTVEEQLDS